MKKLFMFFFFDQVIIRGGAAAVVAPDAESDGGSIATTPPITGQVAPAAPGAPKKDLKRHAEENFEDEKDNLTEDGSLTGSPVKKQQVNMKKKKINLVFE